MKIKLDRKSLEKYNLKERFLNELRIHSDDNRYYYKDTTDLLNIDDFNWFFLTEYDMIVRERKEEV